MMILLKDDCPLHHRASLTREFESRDIPIRIAEIKGKTAFILLTPDAAHLCGELEDHPAVEEIQASAPACHLVTKDHAGGPTTFDVGNVSVGEGTFAVIAGPCSVESAEQIREASVAAADAGAAMLRGGAFKPRTSPYSFQGLGERGLELLAEAGRMTGLPVVTELMAPEHLDLVATYADVIQIGARNMQNFPLLKLVGEQEKPVFLKRSPMATIDEWLCAAEYIAAAGNSRIILCERGIRTFERATRNTLDITAVPVLKSMTHLPVFIDPSHAAGKREWVASLSMAALAAGADGLMIEAHPCPEKALSDGRQSLTLEALAVLMKALTDQANSLGKDVQRVTETV